MFHHDHFSGNEAVAEMRDAAEAVGDIGFPDLFDDAFDRSVREQFKHKGETVTQMKVVQPDVDLVDAVHLQHVVKARLRLPRFQKKRRPNATVDAVQKRPDLFRGFPHRKHDPLGPERNHLLDLAFRSAVPRIDPHKKFRLGENRRQFTDVADGMARFYAVNPALTLFLPESFEIDPNTINPDFFRDQRDVGVIRDIENGQGHSRLTSVKTPVRFIINILYIIKKRLSRKNVYLIIKKWGKTEKTVNCSKKRGEAGLAGGPEGGGGGAVGVGELEFHRLRGAVDFAGGEVCGGGAEGEARQAPRALLGGDGEEVFERGVVAEVDERGGLGAEVGADDARLKRDGGDPAVAAAALQFAGEEDIAEFRAPVGAEWSVILLAFGIGGVEIRAEQVGGDAGGLDHGRPRRGEFIEEQTGQKELREQVDLEGALETVLGQRPFLLRAAGVVGEDVDLVVLPEFRREARDVGQFGVVGEMVRAAEFGGDLLGFFGIAPDEDHAMPRPDEGARGGGADPVAAPGDDDRFLAVGLHSVSFRPPPALRGAVVNNSRFSPCFPAFVKQGGAPGVQGRRAI